MPLTNPPLQLTARELLDSCIRGLDSVEKWLEELRANPADEKRDRKLADSLDYVCEIRRRLKSLLADPSILPDLKECVAVARADADEVHRAEKDRTC
jgi:hypothetical protein